ncbi:MAG: hypothetical protein LUH11_01685 [Candidatus Gastranaerophilales bacterium]|nr:hypothetical protein [Candidatus Gastranaerophilales bacterium]
MADKINKNLNNEEYVENTEENEMYEYDNQDVTDEEYQAEEDEEDESSVEDYEDEDGEEKPAPKKKNQLLILIILLIVLGLLGLLAIPKLMGNKNSNSAIVKNEMSENTEQNSNPSDDNLANTFFDESGGENNDMMSVDFNDNGDINVSDGEGEDGNVATVSDADSSDNVSSEDLFGNQEEHPDEENHENQENNAIMVVYNKAARINPFKPPVVKDEEQLPFEEINNTPFEIIEPPTVSVPDENLSRLLQTQISGILYDDESPSAIVNLNGIDQFVKVGDVISGYKIVQITNDKVQIDYKNNSYVAAIGELFTKGSLEKQSAVVNLNNKFAGRYKNNN